MNTTITENKVKQGYKKTPVGMIPEEWEVKKLRDICELKSGGTPSRKEDKYWNGTIPWITTSLVDFNKIKETEEFITAEGLENSSANVFPKGTTIMAIYGQGVTRGKVARLGIDASTNQACVAFLNDNMNLQTYLFYSLSYRYLKLRNLSNDGSQKNLSSSILREYKLPIPPLPEQKAIADCLSTWDKGIEKLSALIASKKQQKKGLMQGLFSGELKVENEELVKIEDEKLWLKGWKEVRLGDIGVFRTSSVNKKIVESETKVWLLNYMDVYKNTHITSEIEFQLTSAKDSQIESSNLMIGDVLFTPSSETPDDIGHSAVVTENLENVVFSYHLVRFRVKRNLLDIDFSGHVFNKSDILNEFSRRATGSTRYTLSLKDFNEITTKLPELNEQKAISSVLTTADKEIELLEKKLEAFKTQKKGLMQVLLTGERRLV